MTEHILCSNHCAELIALNKKDQFHALLKITFCGTRDKDFKNEYIYRTLEQCYEEK